MLLYFFVTTVIFYELYMILYNELFFTYIYLGPVWIGLFWAYVSLSTPISLFKGVWVNK